MATTTPNLTLHHLQTGQGERIPWLLEELSLPYKLVPHKRSPLLSPPELKALHPLGASPLLEDHTSPTHPISLAESGAIVEYLVDQAGGALRPSPGTADHRRYVYWTHFAEGTAMPPLVMALVFHKIKTAPMPFFAKPIAKAIADKVMKGFVGPQVKLHMDWMERELAQSPWFAGERFTAADIQMSFPIQAAAARGGDMAAYPRLQAYLARIEQRPAYQRAVERGGPLNLGGGSR